MSNRLKMSKSQFIIALREKGWSLTRIARELGVHRHTVARYVDQHAKSPQAPDPDGPKSTQLHSGSDEPKSTEAAGWHWRNRGLRAAVRVPLASPVSSPSASPRRGGSDEN